MNSPAFFLRWICLCLSGCVVLLSSTCTRTQEPLLVAAAISLRPVLEKLQAAYPHGDQLRFSYASSGVIRQQITEGAPYAVFLSAGTLEIQKLAEKGIQGDQTTLAHNPLVIARLQASTTTAATDCAPQDLLTQREATFKLAVGNPKTVPVGYAAQQALGSDWQALSPHFLFTENAYQNIVYLRNQAVDYALVYQSDLTAYPDIQSCWAFSAQSGVAVTALALPKKPPHPLQADWLSFLASEHARPLWSKSGFSLP